MPPARIVPTLGGLAIPPQSTGLRAIELVMARRASGVHRGPPTRNPAQRRAYAERRDPQGYIADIFGYRLTEQQEAALDFMNAPDLSPHWLLIPGGNNIGKSLLIASFALYLLDPVAAILDPETGREQGARILLPGPDQATIFETIYSQMLKLARRAEARGYAMPGRRSENSILWRVEPTWEVEAFHPPASAHEVAGTASGRHHRVQAAFIEEAMVTRESVWRGTEGMCSASGNMIIASFNPTTSAGPAFTRSRGGLYRVLHLDAFDHPNIRTRSQVIPAAIGYDVIDARVSQCQVRGDYPETFPDPSFGEFIYALPEAGTPERGPRDDGHLGHPDAPLKVYRPTPTFESQVRGCWPRTADFFAPFEPGSLDAAMARWRAGADPAMTPDRIGIDAAREGDDDCAYAPAWGLDGEELLRRYAAALEGREEGTIEFMRIHERARVGAIRVAPKGRGPEVAEHIALAFPGAPWNVDEGGVGSSVYDHARDVLGVDAEGVSFSASPPERLPGEIYCENARAALYARAGMLVTLGLVDVPDDPALREELLAHRYKYGTRTVAATAGDNGHQRPERRRMQVVRVEEKPEIKRRLGRSPDRADAFVLALWRARPRGGGWYLA